MIPKFRAWHKKEKKMIKSDVLVDIHFEDKSILEKETFYTKDGEIALTNYNEYDFGRIILMQSTGLFDKNGVEIFEGDVVKDDETPKEIYICKRSGITPRLELQTKDKFILRNLFEHDVKNLEVIGNIYGNPELLEVENA